MLVAKLSPIMTADIIMNILLIFSSYAARITHGPSNYWFTPPFPPPTWHRLRSPSGCVGSAWNWLRRETLKRHPGSMRKDLAHISESAAPSLQFEPPQTEPEPAFNFTRIADWILYSEPVTCFLGGPRPSLYMQDLVCCPSNLVHILNLYKEIVGTWALMVKVGQDSEPSSPQKGIAIQNTADINGPSRIPIKDQNPQQKKPSGHCKRSVFFNVFFFFCGRFCFFWGGSWFSAFLLLCISSFLLLCFSDSLLFCFSASPLLCFSAFLLFAFPASLIFCVFFFSSFLLFAFFSCFSAFLLLCFHCFFAFPLLFCLFSLLFCFFVSPASLLSCFCAFLLLLFYCFFSSVMCFCCSTSCSFASLLPVFTVSLLFIFVCFILSCLYPLERP